MSAEGWEEDSWVCEGKGPGLHHGASHQVCYVQSQNHNLTYRSLETYIVKPLVKIIIPKSILKDLKASEHLDSDNNRLDEDTHNVTRNQLIGNHSF